MTASSTHTNTLATTKALISETGLKHVAIIMDGNRRWAKERNLPTLEGHRQGVETLKTLVRHCGEVKLEALTVYAFSTENWQRTSEEVGYLMGLFVTALSAEMKALHENNVRLKFIGDLSALDPKLQKIIADAETMMANNTGLKFQVATNYGSRAEIINAIKQITNDIKNNTLQPEEITEELLSEKLYTHGLPDPDMLVRTGGEMRVSNYLLWQCAYAELYVTPVMWPEFSPAEFDKSVQEFAHRQRRFGK